MGFGKGLGSGQGFGYGRGFGRGAGRGKGAFSGFSCVKFFFFGFNVLFWLLGCAILGVGIWLQVSKGTYASLSPSFNFLSATVLCIAAGLLILLVGFFGCCGAIMENKCLLITYFSLVVLIFIMEIVSAVLIFVYRSDIENMVGSELQNGITYRYPINGEDEEGLKATWAYVQSSMECCGVYNYTDWYKTEMFDVRKEIPRECCIDENNCAPDDPQSFYQNGCLSEVKLKFELNLYIVGIIAICIAVIQILGLIASMVLFCCLRREKY